MSVYVNIQVWGYLVKLLFPLIQREPAMSPVSLNRQQLHPIPPTDCVLSIVESVNAEVIDIISASSGASVSYAFTRKYPERVRHLALGGVTHRLGGHARESIQRGVNLLQANEMHGFA
ncbi:MAG: hypothetical protein WBG01_10770, partial [Bacteroidota bacterium]